MRTLIVFGLLLSLMASTGQASIHLVQPGETLSQIAERYENSLDALMAMNEIRNANQVQVGQLLRYVAECDIDVLDDPLFKANGEPADLITITRHLASGSSRLRNIIDDDVIFDAGLWCKHMLTRQLLSDDSYQYFHDCRQELLAGNIRYPDSSDQKSGVLWRQVMKFAQNWRQGVLAGRY